MTVKQLLGIPSTADHIAVRGLQCQQSGSSRSSQQADLFHGRKSAVEIAGCGGNRGMLEHLQSDTIHDRICQLTVVIDDGFRHLKCSTGIRSRHLHLQQIGLAHHIGLNGTVKGTTVHFLHDLFPKNGAVEQFFKNDRQVAGRGQVIVHRGGCTAGRNHERGGGGIDGLVSQIRIDIGTHAHHQCSQNDQKPTLCYIHGQQDGVKRQKTIIGNIYFICLFHRLFLHHHDQPAVSDQIFRSITGSRGTIIGHFIRQSINAGNIIIYVAIGF